MPKVTTKKKLGDYLTGKTKLVSCRAEGKTTTAVKGLKANTDFEIPKNAEIFINTGKGWKLSE